MPIDELISRLTQAYENEGLVRKAVKKLGEYAKQVKYKDYDRVSKIVGKVVASEQGAKLSSGMSATSRGTSIAAHLQD